jgi:hypothetical protein
MQFEDERAGQQGCCPSCGGLLPVAKRQSSIKGSIGGGLLLMLIAVVWFAVGLLTIHRVFIYPPVLFVLGLLSLLAGMARGN